MSCNCFNCTLLNEYQSGKISRRIFNLMRFAYFFGQISSLYTIHKQFTEPDEDDDMPLPAYVSMSLDHATSAVRCIQADSKSKLMNKLIKETKF